MNYSEMTNRKLSFRIKILGTLLLVAFIILLLFYSASAMAMNRKSFYVTKEGSDAGEGISLSESRDFRSASTVLECASSEEFTCISGLRDIPESFASCEGSCGGDNYIAYAFYMKNPTQSGETIKERILLDSASKNADAALRVKVYRNEESVVFAKASYEGLPEYGTAVFESDSLVYESSHLVSAGETVKYVVVLWIEGDDPECDNSIGGGFAALHMEFETETGK